MPYYHFSGPSFTNGITGLTTGIPFLFTTT